VIFENKTVKAPNRAKRRADEAAKQHESGASVVQIAKRKRQTRLVKLRRAHALIRLEMKKIERRAKELLR
jgi:hypothetical protein